MDRFNFTSDTNYKLTLVMDTTLKIAIYGAVLSTLNAIVHIFNYRRDRANLKITVKGNMEIYPPTTIYGDKTYICIDVANRGRRAVTISQCVIKMPKEAKKGWMLLTDSFYKQGELLEGKSQTYMMSQNEIKKYNLNDKDLVVCVIDATGRYYWADNFLMRWIKSRRCKSKIAKAEIYNKKIE